MDTNVLSHVWKNNYEEYLSQNDQIYKVKMLWIENLLLKFA